MGNAGARRVLIVLWAIYAVARVLQAFPTKVPTLLIVVLHVVPVAAFALVHGWRAWAPGSLLSLSGFASQSPADSNASA